MTSRESETDADHDSDAHDADGVHDSDADNDTDGTDDGDTASAGLAAASEGSCTAAGTWRLEVERDDGSVELELTVHGTAAHGSWLVEISQNGSRFYSAEVPSDESGEVEIEAERPFGTGAQAFTFSAHERSTDGSCAGSVSV